MLSLWAWRLGSGGGVHTKLCAANHRLHADAALRASGNGSEPTRVSASKLISVARSAPRGLSGAR